LASTIIEYFNYFYELVVGNFQLIGLAVLLFMLFKDRQQLKIKWDKLSYFVGFMVFVSLIRMCISDMSPSNASPVGFNRLSLYHFLFVGLEDAFFVMIPLYITRFCKTRVLKFAIWIMFSAFFALGHGYQGISAIFLTALYPYFISRYYILRTNLATVMACHFVYDCITFLTVKLSKLLQYV
jgi:hypothetical protein